MIDPAKVEGYDNLPRAKRIKTGFLKGCIDAGNSTLPGVYCATCGATYCYYTGISPWAHGIDKNGKAYYNNCFKCGGNKIWTLSKP